MSASRSPKALHAASPRFILAEELATFERALPDLLHGARGRFALVRADQVAGTFPTREAALDAGYERFGVDTPFLVKPVQPFEQSMEFARDPGQV